MIPAPDSLRGRLLLGALAVGISFAVLFGLGATWRVNQLEDGAVHAALTSRLDLARDSVTATGSLKPDRDTPKTNLVQVIGPDGRVRSSSKALAGVRPLVSVADVSRSSEGVQRRVTLQQPDIELAALGVPLRLPQQGSSPAGTGALVVAVDAEGFTAATSDLRSLLLIGLISVVTAIALLSWMLTGRALRSVTRLTEEAEMVSPRNLADGLPIPQGDAELERLVGALNRMLARLDESHAKELQFAADAGHRLRTPVSTLRAEAELALRDDDPAEHRAALHRIMQDADHLTLVVDRMLARIRSGTAEPEFVIPAVRDAAKRWARQAEIADVEVDLCIDSAVSAEAECAELVTVVEPLVDNAIRHTPTGGTVTVALRLDVEKSARNKVVVDVSDTGPGIPEDIAPTIFDAWVSTRDASLAGGLGLWLARETARDLDGDITLLADPGGSTFRVTLPASEPA